MRTLIGLAVISLSTACGATRLQHAWVKPGVGTLNVKRVVAIGFSKDPARRRAMEASKVEQLRDAIPGVQATESSTLINDADIRDEAKTRASPDHGTFDAQIVMRVTDVTRTDVYVPGRTRAVPVYYRTFWGYYRYWVPIAYEPGYVEHDRDVEVETAVYSARGDGELAYSAVSHTLNPSSAADLAKDVTGAVARDLRKKGLLVERTH